MVKGYTSNNDGSDGRGEHRPGLRSARPRPGPPQPLIQETNIFILVFDNENYYTTGSY